MKKIVIIGLFLVSGISGYAQCNSKLLEIAASESGTDAIFVRDFKVRLEEGTIRRPSPVGRFQVYLNEGIHYRFNVVSAMEYQGRAILQLYDRNNLMGSTFDLSLKKDLQYFDFISEKTGSYQILMTFFEGKSGCAVGVMSMVLSDTTIYKTGNITANDDNGLETLYIGIDNEINIAATDIPGGSLDVSMTGGSIEGSNGRYIARVNKEGIATVRVIARDKNDRISEIDSIQFRIIPVPLPYVELVGLNGGMIHKSQIDRINEISLVYPLKMNGNKYKIIEFTISAESNMQRDEISRSNLLTISQKSLIKGLDQGDRFMVKNIIAQGPDGKIYTLKPLVFVVDQ